MCRVPLIHEVVMHVNFDKPTSTEKFLIALILILYVCGIMSTAWYWSQLPQPWQGFIFGLFLMWGFKPMRRE
jgi:hypothetical protein